MFLDLKSVFYRPLTFVSKWRPLELDCSAFHAEMNQQEFTSQELIITIVCASIFVFGVLGNGLTLWVLLRSGRWRKNTTNMFIVSLTLVQDFDNSHFHFLDVFRISDSGLCK